MSNPQPEPSSSLANSSPIEIHKTALDSNSKDIADMTESLHDLEMNSTAVVADCQPGKQDATDRQQIIEDTAVITEPVRQHSSPAEPAQEYLVKTIDWFDYSSNQKRTIKIITQNENGPCPLLAICNVLLLRGDLEIRPPDREMVTFEYLVDRLGDYLLTHAPSEHKNSSDAGSQEDVAEPRRPTHKLTERQSTAEYLLTYRHNLDAALSIIPNLQTGLDVNIRFSSINGFEPTAELALFDLFGVDLVHGWIADPQDNETYQVVVKQCGSYNAVVECVVQGDTICNGTVVESRERQEQECQNQVTREWAQEDEQKLHQGLVASAFLQDTATQLTYYGLELLVDSISKDRLCVLFRNNHVKHPETGQLYTLVTDSGLVSERAFVWESLTDVDQGTAEFFDDQFRKPRIASQEATQHHRQSRTDESTDLDLAIALSLQQQEHELCAGRSHNATPPPPKQAAPIPPSTSVKLDSLAKRKKQHSCIIM
ncbi:hypothetical protein DFQ28_000934 [Apophysomyces sp. BC1034]|nr:hypothetical protein DFQ28_000934 [Apophysomyces sp. BC1034]